MNSGLEIRTLLYSVRPVNLAGLSYSALDTEQFFRLWKNASAIAEFVQKISDPHGDDRDAERCRLIIRQCADFKQMLAELTAKRRTKKQTEKMIKRVVKEYSAIKEEMTKLGASLDPFWGKTIPQLMEI